jgi:hypothetical protein
MLPRTLLLLAAKVAVSVVLFAVLLRRIDWSQVAPTLERARPEWLLAACSLLVASNIVGSWQWSRLLRAVDIPLPFWKVVAYYHVGLFWNNFLPANVGGDIARVSDAARAGSTRATAFSTVLLDRLIGTTALGGLAVITTLPAIDHFHLAAVYLGILGFFLVAVAVLWAVLHTGFLALVDRALSAVGLARMRPALAELAQRLAAFRSRRPLLARLLLVAVAVQVMRIFVHVAVARALDLHIEWTYFFLFVPLLAVIVSLPISLNGIGVREGAGIVLFGLVGLDKGAAFLLQFTTYLVAVAVSMIGGLVFLVRLPRRRAQPRSRRPGA